METSKVPKHFDEKQTTSQADHESLLKVGASSVASMVLATPLSAQLIIKVWAKLDVLMSSSAMLMDKPCVKLLLYLHHGQPSPPDWHFYLPGLHMFCTILVGISISPNKSSTKPK